MSSGMQITQVEKFEVLPSNQPSNNTYSFRRGNPIVTFNVGSTAKLLRASSVRINGVLTVHDATSKLPSATAINQSRAGDLTAKTATDVQINSRVGTSGMFQNVNLSSNDTGQTLESVRQYGRLCASVLSSTHSSEDFLHNTAVSELNPGVDTACANMVSNSTHFSVRLFAGMLQGGNAIPMGANGVRGLTITLELASDQQFLKGAAAGTGGGASYEIKDLSLTGDYLVLDPASTAKLAVPGNGGFAYNSWNNLYSVIDSADSTQTYNLSQSNVLKVFHNFLPVPYSNNYAADCYKTDLPELSSATSIFDPAQPSFAQIKKVSFSRAGMKLALDYDIDVETASSAQRPQTQLEINYLNAISPYATLSHTLQQPLLLGFGGKDRKPFDPSLDSVTTVDAGAKNFGIGINVDPVSSVGLDFRGQSYATRITSNLDGKSPNAVFTYVLAKNMLQYTPQGIQVMS
tara:strand:- start:44 stop:1426 length:1383 start_codon:yes stop_codon:yes gene_type:complete